MTVVTVVTIVSVVTVVTLVTKVTLVSSEKNHMSPQKKKTFLHNCETAVTIVTVIPGHRTHTLLIHALKIQYKMVPFPQEIVLSVQFVDVSSSP